MRCLSCPRLLPLAPILLAVFVGGRAAGAQEALLPTLLARMSETLVLVHLEQLERIAAAYPAHAVRLGVGRTAAARDALLAEELSLNRSALRFVEVRAALRSSISAEEIRAAGLAEREAEWRVRAGLRPHRARIVELLGELKRLGARVESTQAAAQEARAALLASRDQHGRAARAAGDARSELVTSAQVVLAALRAERAEVAAQAQRIEAERAELSQAQAAIARESESFNAGLAPAADPGAAPETEVRAGLEQRRARLAVATLRLRERIARHNRRVAELDRRLETAEDERGVRHDALRELVDRTTVERERLTAALVRARAAAGDAQAARAALRSAFGPQPAALAALAAAWLEGSDASDPVSAGVETGDLGRELGLEVARARARDAGLRVEAAGLEEESARLAIERERLARRTHALAAMAAAIRVARAGVLEGWTALADALAPPADAEAETGTQRLMRARAVLTELERAALTVALRGVAGSDSGVRSDYLAAAAAWRDGVTGAAGRVEPSLAEEHRDPGALRSAVRRYEPDAPSGADPLRLDLDPWLHSDPLRAASRELERLGEGEPAVRQLLRALLVQTLARRSLVTVHEGHRWLILSGRDFPLPAPSRPATLPHPTRPPA